MMIPTSLSYLSLSFLLRLGSHSVAAFSVTRTTATEVLDNNDTTTIDVAIVGAGPSGLALAHCLIDRGYDVRVVERRESFRPVGSAVFLHPFALHSLRNLSPDVLAANVLEAATQVGTISIQSTTNAENRAVFDQLDKAPEFFGMPFVTIKFWDLLQSLRRGLPEETFCFGSDVQGYRKRDDGRVELLYRTIRDSNTNKEEEQEKEEQSIMTARIIVDAGGIRSNIRKQMLPDSQSVPLCKAYMAVLDAEKANPIMNKNNNNDRSETMAERELGFLAGDVDGMTLATLENGDVWWTYTYFDEDLASSLPQEELVRRVAGRYPPFVSELLARTENRVETVVADLPVTWQWGDGPVTLLGDSAHAQLPALGLGCSSAFADIEELCQQIDRNGLCETALRHYERWRIPQTAVLQKASRFTYGGIRNVGTMK